MNPIDISPTKTIVIGVTNQLCYLGGTTLYIPISGLNLQKHAALYPVDFRAAHGGDRPKGARVPGLPHGRFLRAEEMLSFAI